MSSRLYKAGYLQSSSQIKVIEPKPLLIIDESEPPEAEILEECEHEEQEKIEIPAEITAMIEEAKVQAAELLAEAEQQATAIIGTAEQRRQEMQEELNQKAQEVYERAQNEGHREGYELGQQAGRTSAQTEYQEILKEANRILAEAITHKQKEICDAENVIVDLAYAIACKVVRKNPEILKDQIVDLVVLAMKKIRDTEKVEIQVHPDDFAKVQQALPTLKNVLAGKADIMIQAEPHIEAGGVQLHTSMGTIDAKITTQFDEIKKSLQSLDLGRDDFGDT